MPVSNFSSSASVGVPFVQKQFPIRVSLAIQNGQSLENGSYEVMMINPSECSGTRPRVYLENQIKSFFHKVEAGVGDDRANISHRLFWSAAHQIKYIMAVWDVNFDPTWESKAIRTTRITNLNLHSVLAGFSRSQFNTISLEVVLEERSAVEVEKEEARRKSAEERITRMETKLAKKNDEIKDLREKVKTTSEANSEALGEDDDDDESGVA